MTRVLRSLHLRLVFLLLLLLAATWLGLYINSRQAAADRASTDIDKRLQAAASQMLQVAAATAKPGQPELPLPESQDSEFARTSSRFEIVTHDNRVVARSQDFPEQVRSSRPGFENHVVDGRPWRVYTVSDHRRGFTCRVASPQAQQNQQAAALNRDFTQPLFWLLPLFALAALAAVWGGLAPIRKIEKAIANQDPSDPQPLSIDRRHIPPELEGLLGVINKLFTRLSDVLSRQRLFTAAAGHELRTPLAGCKAQVQLAQRSRDVATQNRALMKAQKSIDRMTHLINQLLMLARVDPAAPQLQCVHVDMVALVRERVAAREKSAAEKDIVLCIHADSETARLAGDRTLIEAMVANVIDNAIRFSPANVEVDIRIHCRDGGIMLTVHDRGTGIPEDEYEHVFDHFYRRGTGGGPGSGLGLTLVRAIARAHGGEAELQSAPGGGTTAVVRLPRSKPLLSRRPKS